MTYSVEVFDSIYQQVYAIIKTRHIDITIIMTLAADAINIVEQVPGIIGADKKQLVIDVINRVARTVIATPELEAVLTPEIRSAITLGLASLPMICDTIVNFGNMIASQASQSAQAVVDDGVAKKGCFCC